MFRLGDGGILVLPGFIQLRLGYGQRLLRLLHGILLVKIRFGCLRLLQLQGFVGG
ncbi:hypothetical protein D3C81_2316950 [compost metagenome]